MEVIPAIDLKEGRCVRLLQGDFDRETVYSRDPVKMANHWQNLGAQRLHIVDLDGAKTGIPGNLLLIKKIVTSVSIPIQLGGGIRSRKMIKQYLDSGVNQIILGTVALIKPAIVAEAVAEFGSDKIIVGVDAREDRVAVQGWQETSTKIVVEVIKDLNNKGVITFIYTDISRDGTLRGPDLTGLAKLVKMKGFEIIASGGVSNHRDLEKLKEIGIKKAIVGQALYSEKLDVKKLWT